MEAQNNKYRTVKCGATTLVWQNTGYLDLNFNTFQWKSNRILAFTPVEGFSNISSKFFIYYSSSKLLSVTYIHDLYCYMLYISYIINTFHALYITKNCPVQCLSLILCNYYFLLQIAPRPLFSACIITPVNFVDTFHLLMSGTSIPYLKVSVTHETYMYQLTSSQTHKMAIEYLHR